MDDEWQLPVAKEGPEIHKARVVRDEKGGLRLVPDHNFVEGEMDEDASKAPSGRPFSST